MRIFAAVLAVALAAGLSSSAVAAPGALPAPNVKVGDPALLFSLPAINEEAALRAVARPNVALSDFTGVLPGFPARVVVVHFVDRRAAEGQLQVINRLQKRYGNRGARFVAILVDNSELATLAEWVESQRLDFPVLRDAHRVVADRYGVQRFPLTVIVDSAGDIDAIGAPTDTLETSIEAQILPFLSN